MVKQESVISIDNVWKKYDLEKNEPLVVLKEISLDINLGEFVAITGPSGSGKSTMLSIVGVLDKPSWGDIYISGKRVSDIDESELARIRGRKIGFIFQQFNLIKNLTALQNVMLPMEILDMPSSEAKSKAVDLLIKLDLGDRMNHKPNQLSGGQQQRVAIARALANDPDIILADEPTGNLDSKTGEFVMKFLVEMNKKGKTIILITHDTNLVKYAKRIIKMKDGMIENYVEIRR